jgi:hypothetical protein
LAMLTLPRSSSLHPPFGWHYSIDTQGRFSYDYIHEKGGSYQKKKRHS